MGQTTDSRNSASNKITTAQVNEWQSARSSNEKNGFNKTPAGDGKRLAEVLVESCIADNGPEYTNEDVEVLIAAAINKTGSTLRIGGASNQLRTAFFDRLVELAIAKVVEKNNSNQDVNEDKLDRLFMMLVLPMADQKKFYTKYWEHASNTWLTESYLYKAIKKSVVNASKDNVKNIGNFLFELMQIYSKEINYNTESIERKEEEREREGKKKTITHGYSAYSSNRGIIKIALHNRSRGTNYEITKYFSTVLTFLHSSCNETEQSKRKETIEVIENIANCILLYRIQCDSRDGYGKNFIPLYHHAGFYPEQIQTIEKNRQYLFNLFSQSFSLVARYHTIADSFLTAVGPALPTFLSQKVFDQKPDFYLNLHLAYEIIRRYLIIANPKEKKSNYQKSKMPLKDAHVERIDPSSASTGDYTTLLKTLKQLAALANKIKKNVDPNVAKLYLKFEAGNTIKFTENLENRTQGLEASQKKELVNQATRLCAELANLEKHAGLSGQEKSYTKHLVAKSNSTALQIEAGQATQTADKIHLLLESIKNATTTEELTKAYNKAQPLVSSQANEIYKHTLAIALLEAEAANSVLRILIEAAQKNWATNSSKNTEKALIKDIAAFLKENLDNTDKKALCFYLIRIIHGCIVKPSNTTMKDYIKSILNSEIPSNTESKNPQHNSESLGAILLEKINESTGQNTSIYPLASAPPVDDSSSTVNQANNDSKQEAHTYTDQMPCYFQEISAHCFTSDDFVIAYIVAKEIFDNELLTEQDESQLIQSLAQKQYNQNFENISFAEAVALLYFFHQFANADEIRQESLINNWRQILSSFAPGTAEKLWRTMADFANHFKNNFGQNQLAQKLEKEHRKISCLPDPDDKLANLEFANAYAEEKMLRLTQQLEAQHQEIQRLLQELKNEKTQTRELSGKNGQLTEAHQKLEEKLQATSDQHSTKMAEQVEKIEELEKQNSDLTETLGTQSEKLEKKNQEAEKLERELQQAQEEIQTLKKQAQQQTTATPATSGSQSRTTKNLVGEINKNRRKIIKKHKEDAEDSENPKVKMDKHVKQYPPKPALTSEAKKFYDFLFLFAMQEYQNIELDTDNSEDHADNCWVLLCLAELITQCETANTSYVTDELANSLINTLKTIQEHIVDLDGLRSDNQHTTAIESSLNRVGSLLSDSSSGLFATPDYRLSNALANTKDALGFGCNN